VTEPAVDRAPLADVDDDGQLASATAPNEAAPDEAVPDEVAPNAVAPDGTGRGRPGRFAHLGALVLAALLGAGLAYAEHQNARATLIAVALTQALFVLSWVFSSGLPGRLGALGIGAASSAVADTIVNRWPHDELGTLVAVLGLALPAMFIHQLVRGRRRIRVVESLSDVALLVVGTVALAVLIQLRHEASGQAMGIAVVLCAGVALVAGHFVDAIWSPIRFDPAVSRGVPALLVSIAAGAVVGYQRLHGLGQFGDYRSLGVGASVAAVTALFAVGAGFIETASTLPSNRTARLLRPLFATTCSFALMSPVAYLLCLVIRR
jgi:hypothetical protein